MRWDHSIDCSRQHRTAQRVEPAQAFARGTRLDNSPFQIKFQLSASWVVMALVNGNAGEYLSMGTWEALPWALLDGKICILLSGPMSLCDPVHDELAPRRVYLWACRGWHTLSVAANVGKNGTGDCARDSHRQRRTKKRAGRNYR